jgi:GMP synthase (glutamine-hydrolysing)
MSAPRYLLLQIRKPEDPMQDQEVSCFARSLECDVANIWQHDLISSSPTKQQLTEFDAVFVGGSGDFSVVKGGDWLPAALEGLRLVANSGVPTFASCWGFQAISAAFGGRVVQEPQYAELGSTSIKRTPAGAIDPVFSVVDPCFLAHSGHEDTVVELPDEAQRLASSERVVNQALKLVDRPVYATQFHPELRREDYLQRLRAYPKYVAELTGLPFDEFADSCRETPSANLLLQQFVQEVVKSGGRG